jgi:hypothetical protein
MAEPEIVEEPTREQLALQRWGHYENFPKEERDALVVADLLSGVNRHVIKEKYSISFPTISRIYRSMPKDLKEKFDLDKQEGMADLVMQSLESSMQAAVNIMNMTNDPDWMRTQNAGDLNKLYGTAMDKSLRMLQTIDFQKNQPTEETESEDN